jgi:uncharacterized membrane protein YeaQ/YmgE (transglycosylase-associated protein family)
MHILVTLIVGLIAGVIAKLLHPGKDPGGVLVTMLIGVAGSFIAGALGHAFHWYKPGKGPGIIASTIGAFVLLVIYRAIVHRRRAEPTQGATS